MTIDPDKTLHELEGDGLGETLMDPSSEGSYSRLRHKLLRDLTTEDLRVLIGQKMGLPFLVPVAIERLEVNPFARGDDHLGDLLLNVLKVDADFWRGHQELLWRFQEILINLMPVLQSLQVEINRFVNQEERFNRPGA